MEKYIPAKINDNKKPVSPEDPRKVSGFRGKSCHRK